MVYSTCAPLTLEDSGLGIDFTDPCTGPSPDGWSSLATQRAHGMPKGFRRAITPTSATGSEAAGSESQATGSTRSNSPIGTVVAETPHHAERNQPVFSSVLDSSQSPASSLSNTQPKKFVAAGKGKAPRGPANSFANFVRTSPPAAVNPPQVANRSRFATPAADIGRDSWESCQQPAPIAPCRPRYTPTTGAGSSREDWNTPQPAFSPAVARQEAHASSQAVASIPQAMTERLAETNSTPAATVAPVVPQVDKQCQEANQVQTVGQKQSTKSVPKPEVGTTAAREPCVLHFAGLCTSAECELSHDENLRGQCYEVLDLTKPNQEGFAYRRLAKYSAMGTPKGVWFFENVRRLSEKQHRKWGPFKVSRSRERTLLGEALGLYGYTITLKSTPKGTLESTTYCWAKVMQ